VQELRFHRIRITADAVQECEGTVSLVTIPRGEIRSVRLEHGVVSEHPMFLFVVAAACLAAGVIGIVLLMSGEGFPKTAALSIALLIPIPWIVAAALRRGPVLLVETKRGVRRLGFGRDVALDGVPEFVTRAQEQQGLAIVANLPRAELR
jgi:hypothetical protein